MKKKLVTAARILAALVFWGLVWQLCAAAVHLEFILPGPIAVFRRLLSLCRTADFYQTILLSFLRIAAGFCGGILAGVLLAFGCAKVRLLDALFSPLMAIIRATPVASFIILVLLWIEKGRVPAFISFLMVLPIVWQNTLLGIRSIDRQTLEMAKVFQITGKRKLFKVELPSILPYFLSASKVSLGLAWKAGVAAEVLALPKVSIGTMIYNAKLYLESTDLYAWTIAIILISVVLEKLFSLLFRGKGESHAAN